MSAITGCEKEPEPFTTNSTIEGFVSLWQYYDTNPPIIKVTASGPYGQKSVNVDPSTGSKFAIEGLGNGTYYLDYSADGYGTLRQYGIQVFGGDTVGTRPANLFKMPSGPFPKLTKTYTAIRDRYGPPTTFVCIETSISDYMVFGLEIMLFFDTSQDVSWKKYAFYYPAWDANFNDANVHTIYIRPELLPFKSGTKVYLKGYPCNTEEYQNGTLDTYLGVRNFSTLDKSKSSDILSFTMP
jgi:hypothetical protein